jgi:hypothetical protein
MNATQLVNLADPRAKVLIEVREIVKDFRGKPLVFIRVRLAGWHFPHRVPEPFALIGDLVSHHVVISRDGLQADAYFDAALPVAPVLSFGYGNVITWDFPFPEGR